MIKGKRGQVATGLLVIIALGLSVSALYNMAVFTNEFNFNKEEFNDVINRLDFSERFMVQQAKLFGKYLVINCGSCSSEMMGEKARIFDSQHEVVRSEADGNFFAKLRQNEFEFGKDEDSDTFYLKIDNLISSSSSGYSRLTREFDICQKFSLEGEFTGDCEINLK